jgi:predicted enzyme related to lactoylglutathione lyase
MLTTRFADGAPNWTDVSSPDTGGARSFYGGLFGWQYRSAGPDAGGYGFFQLAGRTVAGLGPNDPQQGPPAWTVYFRSADAGATAEAAEQAHGRVLAPPMDVMGQGHLAILADKAGVPFGIWQPGRTEGFEVASEPGSLCWVELYTPDVAAGAAFYHRVLGLETSSVSLPGGTYTCLGPAGADEDAMFGGIMAPADSGAADGGPYWLPYFEVEDADATVGRAERLGGAVRMPATTLAGVGRTAQLTDPYGARFAVIRSASQQG